jgi:hypothetical protein
MKGVFAELARVGFTFGQPEMIGSTAHQTDKGRSKSKDEIYS